MEEEAARKEEDRKRRKEEKTKQRAELKRQGLLKTGREKQEAERLAAMREQFLRNNPGVELPPGEQMHDSQIRPTFFGIIIEVLSTLAGLPPSEVFWSGQNDVQLDWVLLVLTECCLMVCSW